jgi:hypothetical protein
MVLTRFKVDIACCVLFFIVVLQVAGFDISSKSQLQETTIHAHTRANLQTLTAALTQQLGGKYQSTFLGV